MAEASSSGSNATRVRRFSDKQIETYHRDGMLRIPGFFETEEIKPIRRACREDPTINGADFGMADEEGKPHPICMWTELADDMIGMIPRMARAPISGGWTGGFKPRPTEIW